MEIQESGAGLSYWLNVSVHILPSERQILPLADLGHTAFCAIPCLETLPWSQRNRYLNCGNGRNIGLDVAVIVGCMSLGCLSSWMIQYYHKSCSRRVRDGCCHIMNRRELVAPNSNLSSAMSTMRPRNYNKRRIRLDLRRTGRSPNLLSTYQKHFSPNPPKTGR